MNKNLLIKISPFVILGLLWSGFAMASVNLTPATSGLAPNTNFALTVGVSSMTNLFGVAFDLDFNPALVSYISTAEGTFMNQGCQTSLMTTQSPAGKLIFGLTRLGAACGGVSGSGTLATINFKTLTTAGTSALTFSNNQLCLLNGTICNYAVDTWNGANVTVQGTVDITPPAAPIGLVAR